MSLRRTTIVDRQSAFDSILSNANEKLFSNDKRFVKVYSLSGAITDDLKRFVKPLAHTKPDRIILHCGTNDLRDKLDSDESKSKVVKVNASISSKREHPRAIPRGFAKDPNPGGRDLY